MHETELARRLFGRLRAGMLLIADRGFTGFDLWRAAAATGADLLWRVRNSAVLPVAEQLADGSYLSHIYAARDKHRHADPITVRVVEYTLAGQATVYRLITTILDPAQAPALDLAALYAQRWELEISLGELKTHQGAPQMVLRSHTPDGVQQEVYGFLLVHYAIRALMHQAALDAATDPDRISFTRTLRLAPPAGPRQAALSPSRLARALTQALAEIQRHLLTRRLRSNPRVIKRKMSNWKLKRAGHRSPRQPSQQPTGTITIVAATKTGPAIEDALNSRIASKRRSSQGPGFG